MLADSAEDPSPAGGHLGAKPHLRVPHADLELQNVKIKLSFPGATGCPWRPCVPLISEQWLLLDLTFLCRNLLWSCKEGIRMSGSFLDAETDTWSQCSQSLWPRPADVVSALCRRESRGHFWRVGRGVIGIKHTCRGPFVLYTMPK